ncbi:MAG: Uroporphyrinogen-III synthase [Candidatus Alkanophagales archaeon MCA70_species_1]|nr:Uroporphyrinogen-III synthase [Candidatus Alkanophaga volatiphilum]
MTRPAKYEQESVAIANAYGFDVFYAPLISVERVWERKFKEFLQSVLRGVANLVVFMSVSSVECVFAHIHDNDPTGQLAENFVRALNNKITVAAVGPATARKLESYGVSTQVLPKEYSSRGLAEALMPLVKGKRVWIVRSRQGDDTLKARLEEAGAAWVQEARIYEITPPKGDERRRAEELIMQLLAGDIEVITFTSGMCVANFFKIAEELGVKDELIARMCNISVAAIGEPTRKKLEAHGVRVDVVPEKFTFEDMMKEVRARVTSSPHRGIR